jgi:hypothetical protein
MKKKSTSIAIASFLVVGLSSISAGALSLPAEKTPSITSCIEKTHKLEVLMVVDESISLIRTKGPGGKKLPGTDVGDERVVALKAVTEVLLDKVNDIDPKRQSKVSVALAGFGNDYEEHQDWLDLNSETVKSFQEVIEDQADRESSQFTRYHRALKGALTTFAKRNSDSGASCRMLIWFSDGQHDDNDAGKFMTSAEESQVTKTICGPSTGANGGLADQLRLQNVYTVAAGLNENESALGLMKLVSQGDGLVKFKNSDLSSCGAVKPEGKFASASKAGDLVKTLVQLLSPTIIDPTEPKLCESGEENCSEYNFVVDSRVSRFTLFVDRGDDDVIATLQSDQTGATTLFQKFSDPNIQQTLLSDNDAFVRVQRKQDGSIDGRWTLKFTGPNHAAAHALFRFVGDADVKVSTKSIDRYETKPLSIAATSKTDGALLEGIRVDLKTRNGLVEVNTISDSGKIVIPASELQRVLSQQELSLALETEMIVTPLGSVDGITDSSTGKNMPIDFGEFSFKLRITSGFGFPEYLGLDRSIPGVDANGNPVFKGTNKKSIGFQFRGASTSDAVVTFTDELESDIGLKFVSGQTCEVKKAIVTTCILELKPSKDSNGIHPAIVKTSSSVTGSEKIQPGEIQIDPETQLPNDPCRGIKIAALLVLSFLLIQALQRFFFAWLISRFGAVSPTARRARVDIFVSNSGDISGMSGSQLVVKTGDESFVFENTESTTQFNLFGYEFICSVWNTFKKSTSMPLGRVVKSGSSVFGSAGVLAPKKSQILELGTEGLVELSLRGQWVIGIANSDLVALTQGTSQVAAELVLYLSPFEQVSLEQQLAEISFTISAGRFPGLLSEVLQKVSLAREELIVEPPGGGGGQIIDPLDPFAIASNPEVSSEPEEQSKSGFFKFFKRVFSRKKNPKKTKSSVEPEVDSGGSSSSYLDPFSN